MKKLISDGVEINGFNDDDDDEFVPVTVLMVAMQK